MKRISLKQIWVGLGLLATTGCTDLSENTYSIIPQDEFYQTKENVLQSFVRPFGHAYWLSSRSSYLFGELSADQYMIVQRGSSPPLKLLTALSNIASRLNGIIISLSKILLQIGRAHV